MIPRPGSFQTSRNAKENCQTPLNAESIRLYVARKEFLSVHRSYLFNELPPKAGDVSMLMATSFNAPIADF